MKPSPTAFFLPLLLAGIALATPPLPASAQPAAPDTLDAGLIAAARSQIQGGAAAQAAKQLRPLVDRLETAPRGATPHTERLLQAWCEALGKGTAPVDSASFARARQSVEVSNALHGEHSLEASTSLLNLGRLFLRTRRNTGEARALVDSAVAIRRTAAGADSLGLAAALVLAGRAARECDDLDASQRCVDEVYEIRVRLLPPGHLDIATALNNRAITRRTRGDLQGAYRDSRAAADMITHKLPPSHGNSINALNTLGITALMAGDPLGGVDAFERAIAGMEQAPQPDSGGMASEYGQLGLAYRDLGDYRKAIASAKKGEAIVESMALPDSFALKNTLVNQGEVLRSSGDFAGARVVFERALAIELARPSASTEAIEAIGQNLGELLREEGRPDSALAYLTRVERLRTRRLGAESVGSVLTERALAWRAVGRPDSARADIARCIEISEHRLGPAALTTAGARMIEARLEAEAGDTARAFAEALAAEAVARARAREILRYVSERQALAFAQNRPEALDLVLSLAVRHGVSPDHEAGAWDCLIRSRGLALDEFAARQADLRARGDSATAELERRWFAAQQRVANLALQRMEDLPDAAAESALASATGEVEALEQQIAKAIGRPEMSAPEPGVGDVLRALPAASALVAYVRWNDAPDSDGRAGASWRYGAWIAAGPSEPAFLDLGPGAAIDSLVREWRRALDGDAFATERDLGSRLRRTVWDPLRARAPHVSRVYLVPDGSLNDVAWYALPRGNRRLLDENVEFRLLSSERDLVRRRAAHVQEPAVLVLGGADFEASPDEATTRLAASVTSTRRSSQRSAGECGEFASRRFGALPFSAHEARDVSALARRRFGPGHVRTLMGAEAGETAFVAAATQATWIHGATHGFFVDRACRDQAEFKDADLDPLLFSGIALAGANHRGEAAGHGEDGILTADELAALDLSRASGMVITGCDTGLGEYVTGEGVFGLRRALERAGVPQLALALWPLDDQATARWSIAFYDGLWSRRLDPATANRDAMRRVRAELRAAGLDDSPRRWGGMVVSGP